MCGRLCCNRQQSHDNCKPLSPKPDSDCCDTVKHGTELDRLMADRSLLTRVKDVNATNQSEAELPVKLFPLNMLSVPKEMRC